MNFIFLSSLFFLVSTVQGLANKQVKNSISISKWDSHINDNQPCQSNSMHVEMPIVPKHVKSVDMKKAKGWKTALQKYHKILPFQMRKWLQEKNGQLVLEMLRKFIKVEKAGRYQLCFRTFGTASCSSTALNSPRPFFIWQKLMVHNLIRDPTKDIIHLLKQPTW